MADANGVNDRGERLTYRELADRLGMSVDAARIKARRRGWKVELGNDGRAIVTVPAPELAELTAERTRSVIRSVDEQGVGEQGPDTSDGRSVDAWAELVTGLREELARAGAALVQASSRAAAAEARAEELRSALDHERQVATGLRDELREMRRPWWRRWLSGS